MAIDLNCDLGEGFGVWRLGDDEALLDVVTSANVACGFHAGDPQIMSAVVRRAAARGVAVGAQVSYADLRGFGRRDLDVPAAELTADVLYQLGALDALARAAGTRVSYVKPHGALYHRITHDPVQAAAVVEALVAFGGLPMLTLPDSVAGSLAAAAGLTVVLEAYADRGYTAAGGLVPRSSPGALVTEPGAVVARVVRMVTEGVVEAVTGELVPVRAASICVHGDTPGGVGLAHAVRDGLADAGVELAAFAG
ncbi:5-oxoprolinase subunit PxpA [Acidothermaceae bacterium B102]|nr:5-oxoprolinase subunit PxpA [Acidothermaceae bacterium B102]